jgi:hypothetical protein
MMDELGIEMAQHLCELDKSDALELAALLKKVQRSMLMRALGYK